MAGGDRIQERILPCKLVCKPPVEVNLEDSPFCSVSVDVCEFTAATVPWTMVFGGFCRVTATDMPMRLEAMLAGLHSAVWKDC